MNWLTLGLMVLIAFIGFHLVMQYQMAPTNSTT